VLNDIDRYHLVQDVIDRLPQLGSRAAYAKQAVRDALIDHKEYIYEHGEDAPEISGWTWGHKLRAGHLDSTEGDNVDAGVEAPVRN
jgi:xylulose-5-phosphate/fructose-6-phosphate phosphoketolase